MFSEEKVVTFNDVPVEEEAETLNRRRTPIGWEKQRRRAVMDFFSWWFVSRFYFISISDRDLSNLEVSTLLHGRTALSESCMGRGDEDSQTASHRQPG
jgi:hypothetical protein